VRTLVGTEPEIVSATAHCDRPGVDTSMARRPALSGRRNRIYPHDGWHRITKFDAWIRVEGSLGQLEIKNPIHPHRGHMITTMIDGDNRTLTAPGQTTYDHQLVTSWTCWRDARMRSPAAGMLSENMAAIDAIYRAAGLSPRGL